MFAAGPSAPLGRERQATPRPRAQSAAVAPSHARVALRWSVWPCCRAARFWPLARLTPSPRTRGGSRDSRSE
eukprot:9495718-Pyramimonas_sp.AAC.1